jgi:hypothetical protein
MSPVFCFSPPVATDRRKKEAPYPRSRLPEFSSKSFPLFLLVFCREIWTTCRGRVRAVMEGYLGLYLGTTRMGWVWS